MLLPGGDHRAGVYGLGNYFSESDYLGSKTFTNMELLAAFNRGEEQYHGQELNDDIWEIAYSEFQSDTEAALEILVLIGRQLEELKPEMELEGIGRRTIKRVDSLARRLQKFDGYRLVGYDTLLTGGWWHDGAYGEPLVETLSEEELTELRSAFAYVAKDALWLYRKVLRTHRRESVGSFMYRGCETILKASKEGARKAYRAMRNLLRLEYGKPLWEIPWKDRWQYKTLKVKVRYKHVAPALGSVDFMRAKLLKMDELGPQRGVILTLRCRSDNVDTLLSILEEYTFRRRKKKPQATGGWLL